MNIFSYQGTQALSIYLPYHILFFDPQKEKYITLRTGGYNFAVTGTPGQAETAAPSYVPAGDVRYIGQDIRFIRNGSGGMAVSSAPLVARTYYWLWFALALFITVVVLLFRREQLKRNADIAGLRNRKAARNARRRLAKANSLLSSGKTEMVNSEIAKALWGYLSDKLSIPMSELTREKCYAAPSQRKAGGELITELDLILSATEYSQYAPKSEGESPAGLYKRASTLISRLDIMCLIKTKLMRRAIVINIILIFCLASSAGQTPEERYAQAGELYSSGDYPGAAAIYRQLYDAGYRSEDLLYNTGNAFFKTGDFASAILFYERAKLIAPADEDIDYNLQIARSKVPDRFETVPQLFFVRWFDFLRCLNRPMCGR